MEKYQIIVIAIFYDKVKKIKFNKTKNGMKIALKNNL
jgi:hypothetical protein